MKTIKILQKNIGPIIILDDDTSDIKDYTKKLSNILEIGNVSILETSTSNVILRPQQIISILVSEANNNNIKLNIGEIETIDTISDIEEIETIQNIDDTSETIIDVIEHPDENIDIITDR